MGHVLDTYASLFTSDDPMAVAAGVTAGVFVLVASGALVTMFGMVAADLFRQPGRR